MSRCASGENNKLLIVLSVNIAQERRQILQQRHRYRPAAHERARFSARQNLALDQQFPVFHFQARGLQQAPHRRLVPHLKNSRHPRPALAGANHLRRRPSAQQQPQRIHHNRFPAARLPGQQIQARMKMDAQPLHHRIVLNHQLEQHSKPIISRNQTGRRIQRTPCGNCNNVASSPRFPPRLSVSAVKARPASTGPHRLFGARARHYARFEIRRRIALRDSRCLPPADRSLGNGPA